MAKAPKNESANLSAADKVLKSKKDPKLQQQLQSEQIAFEAVDEFENIVENSKLHNLEAEKRKKLFRNVLIIVCIGLFGWLVQWLLKPFEADMRFGFCRVFLEQNVQYPDRLVLSTVEERRNFVRIWYMQTDAFGQERLENIECHHGYDDERGYFIDKIEVNRQEIDPESVERFNASLSTIMAYPPDLTYPTRLRDALGNIDIQTYLFRKPIF